MKSKALQNLIHKIFSDEKTKQQFISDPNSVISQYSLTEQEKKAVLKTRAKLSLATPDSFQLEEEVEPRGWWY